MPVAKSYQALQRLSDPYLVNGRSYVVVRMKNGNEKAVRWYTDREYQVYYGESAVKSSKLGVDGTDHSNDPYFKTQKELFGFGEEGYITIFRNAKYEDKNLFKNAGCRYTRTWGWGLPSTSPMIEELPEDTIPVRLYWDKIGNEDGSLKNEDMVKSAIEDVLYDNIGDFVGEVGDKVEIEIEVVKNICFENDYGTTNMMIFKATDDNIYVWTTSAKSWEEGTIHHIKGTIKDHKRYKGVAQTVLTRCREVK